MEGVRSRAPQRAWGVLVVPLSSTYRLEVLQNRNICNLANMFAKQDKLYAEDRVGLLGIGGLVEKPLQSIGGAWSISGPE